MEASPLDHNMDFILVWLYVCVYRLVYVCLCMGLCMHMCAYAYGGQGSISIIFYNHLPTSFYYFAFLFVW